MAEVYNKAALIKIGKSLQNARIKAGLEYEDITEITQLHYITIKAMEEGGNSTLDNFINYCYALNRQPAEVMPQAFQIKSKGKLSPSRLEKSRLTRRIHKLYEENYFSKFKYTSNVCEVLLKKYSHASSSSTVSVILSRMVTRGELTSIKEGNKNLYKARQNKVLKKQKKSGE